MVANEPQPGDFFLAPMGGRAGGLIALAQFLNGDGFKLYQHAGIYLGYNETTRLNETMEAMPGGAIVGNLEYYTKAGASIVWSSGLVELTPSQRLDIMHYARSYQGIPYSFVDYLSILLARFKMRPMWLQQYIGTAKHMICSQLVDRAYLRAGVHLFDDGRISGDVTPADLGNLLEKIELYNMNMGL